MKRVFPQQEILQSAITPLRGKASFKIRLSLKDIQQLQHISKETTHREKKYKKDRDKLTGLCIQQIFSLTN